MLKVMRELATRPFLRLMRRFIGICTAVAVLAGSTEVRADTQVEALAVATAIALTVAIVSPMREESAGIEFEVGRFDVSENVRPANAFGIEYHFGQPLWWKLRPFVGGGVTSRRSVYGYAGIRLATYWDEHVVVTPSFAIGGYSRGEGKDLGQPPVLGRSGLDLEYRFDNDMRVGMAYHHMSNGKVFRQTRNPGTEIAGLTLTIPLQ